MASDRSRDKLDWWLFTINNTIRQIYEVCFEDGSEGENYKQWEEDIVMHWCIIFLELIRINKISVYILFIHHLV